MKKIFLHIILLILLTGLACSHQQAEPGARELSYQLSEAEKSPDATDTAYVAKEGESVLLEPDKLQVSLTEIEDNRCPGDAICITSGEVTTTFTISAQEDTLGIKELTLCKGCPFEGQDSVEFELSGQKYLMVLKDIKPFPLSSQPETMSNKSAEFSLQLLN